MRLLTIALLIALSGTATAQESGKELFGKAMMEMKQHQSLSYTATIHLKYANNRDTAIYSSTVHMLRAERDTMTGGMVWQSDDTKNKSYSFYDLDMRYIVMPTYQKVWREKMEDNSMGLRSHSRHLLLETFLHPDNFFKYPVEKTEVLQDAIIDNQSCYVVMTTQSTEYENIGPIKQTWYFSKTDLFPLLRITSTVLNNDIQYEELKFLSYEYDKVTAEQFSPKQIPADYKVDARKPNVVVDISEKK